MALLGLPGGSGACHILSSVPFPVLIAPQESQRGLYVRFYLQRRTGGKLNEAWTWEQPHLSFSRECSEHIKGNISNVQNKWRDVKTPKDFPPQLCWAAPINLRTSVHIVVSSLGEWKKGRARFLQYGDSVNVRRRLFISVLSSECGVLVVSLPKAFSNLMR